MGLNRPDKEPSRTSQTFYFTWCRHFFQQWLSLKYQISLIIHSENIPEDGIIYALVTQCQILWFFHKSCIELSLLGNSILDYMNFIAEVEKFTKSSTELSWADNLMLDPGNFLKNFETLRSKINFSVIVKNFTNSSIKLSVERNSWNLCVAQLH